MMLSILALLFLLVGSASADETGVEIINTGNVVCSRGVFPADTLWTNNYGRAIRVVRSQIWIGADKDAVADIVAAASRTSDWNILNMFPWDHYTSPTGRHHNTQSNNVTIQPGDGIRLRYFCNFFNKRGTVVNAAVALLIWFE